MPTASCLQPVIICLLLCLTSRAENNTILDPNTSQLEISKDIPSDQAELDKKEDEITEQEYFASSSQNFKCVDHLKMLEIGYSCMDTASMSPEDIGTYTPEDILGTPLQAIHVVSRNGRKYIMKVLDTLYNIELSLLPIFGNDMYSLWLVEYKIIKGRYVGIYSYIEHNNTVYYSLMNNQLSLLDKVVYLERLANLASDFYHYVNPQNGLIQLNLLPSNTLLTKEGFLSLRLINYNIQFQSQEDLLNNPEPHVGPKFPTNQKSRCVYQFGRIIFFYIFGDLPSSSNIDNEPKIIELKEDLSDSEEIRVKRFMVQVIKPMLSTNPIDRPSLELVSGQIKKAIDVLMNPVTWMVMAWKEYRVMIEQEVKNEIDQREDETRLAARQAAVAKMEKKKNAASKDAAYETMFKYLETRNKEYMDFIGERKDSTLKRTTRMINYLDSFSFVPALSSFTTVEETPEDVLESGNGPAVVLTKSEEDSTIKYEFFLILGVCLFLIFMVVAYFCLKNMKMKMYSNYEFKASLVLF